MEIRKMEIKDLQSIMKVIEDAQNALRCAGIDQWQNNYPNEEVMMQDIAQEECYGLIDHRIIGCMTLQFKEETTYIDIDGKWLSQNEGYGTLHRIAILSEVKGKRVADLMLEFAIEKAKERKVNWLRVDTHHQNKSMQKWLSRNGFIYCGIITLMDGALRQAFERRIHDEIEYKRD